jgi:Cys-tRNA(Pro)/Cys-tRNA(Cys) deacylase
MAKKSSGGTPATVALTKAGVAFTVHPYAHSDGVTNFGEEAAAALGVERHRIFKTLVVDAGGELVVAVVPVARQLDLKALAGAAGVKKAVMAEPAAAARSSGYVVGGISPWASGPGCGPSSTARPRTSGPSSCPPASADFRLSWPSATCSS